MTAALLQNRVRVFRFRVNTKKKSRTKRRMGSRIFCFILYLLEIKLEIDKKKKEGENLKKGNITEPLYIYYLTDRETWKQNNKWKTDNQGNWNDNTWYTSNSNEDCQTRIKKINIYKKETNTKETNGKTERRVIEERWKVKESNVNKERLEERRKKI